MLEMIRCRSCIFLASTFTRDRDKKVGLLLIVSLQDNSISRHDQGFKGFNCPVGRKYGAARPPRHRLHSALLLLTPRLVHEDVCCSLCSLIVSVSLLPAQMI